MRKLTPMYYFKQIAKSGSMAEAATNTSKLYAYFVDAYLQRATGFLKMVCPNG